LFGTLFYKFVYLLNPAASFNVNGSLGKLLNLKWIARIDIEKGIAKFSGVDELLLSEYIASFP
jgi:hypothetical protein